MEPIGSNSAIGVTRTTRPNQTDDAENAEQVDTSKRGHLPAPEQLDGCGADLRAGVASSLPALADLQPLGEHRHRGAATSAPQQQHPHLTAQATSASVPATSTSSAGARPKHLKAVTARPTSSGVVGFGGCADWSEAKIQDLVFIRKLCYQLYREFYDASISSHGGD